MKLRQRRNRTGMGSQDFVRSMFVAHGSDSRGSSWQGGVVSAGKVTQTLLVAALIFHFQWIGG